MIQIFDIFRPFSDRLIHGVTTKKAEPIKQEPLFAVQIHGDTIHRVDEMPDHRPTGDALITDAKGLPIGIKVADCQGILLFDPVQNAIAAVHSGWRGSTQNIIGKTVRRMADEFGTEPEDILAAISPSIGPCCLEFTDPFKELPKAVHPFVYKRNLDFWALGCHQLAEAGVRSIELKAECTKCHPDRYYSHRNGDEGRMEVFIGLI